MTDDADWPEELRLDDAEGPAPHLGEAGRDLLVASVLARAGFDAAPKRRPWAARSLAAAVLLACVGAGSASAAVLWYVRSQRPPISERSATSAPKREASPRAAPHAQPSASVAQPSAPVQVAPAAGKRPSRARAAEDWFREGNQLRAKRQWKQADAAYGQAATHAERPEVAYVAYVASAGVRLEHLHDAHGALARYRAALQRVPQGTLDEEIRFGIADAYRALGDGARERAALEEFLRLHAGSPLADQARTRLGAAP